MYAYADGSNDEVRYNAAVGGLFVSVDAYGNGDSLSYNNVGAGLDVGVYADGNMDFLAYNALDGGSEQNIYARGNSNTIRHNFLGAGYAGQCLVCVVFAHLYTSHNLDYIGATGGMNNVNLNSLAGGSENYIHAVGNRNQV